MDNKCSSNLKSTLLKEKVTWQLPPPHQHQANQAENAIQTFKHHFISCMATCDPDFPIQEWDRFLTQCEPILNLLCASRANPKLSVWVYLFGQFDYTQNPLVLPGTRVIANKKVSNRVSWDEHGKKGWNIGPSLNHYRCIKLYFPATRSEKYNGTVTFFPKLIKFPEINFNFFLRLATTNIITLITVPPSTTTLSLEAGDETKNALLKITDILQMIPDKENIIALTKIEPKNITPSMQSQENGAQ